MPNEKKTNGGYRPANEGYTPSRAEYSTPRKERYYVAVAQFGKNVNL